MKTIIVIVAIAGLLFFGSWKMKKSRKKEAESLGTFDIPEGFGHLEDPEDILIFEEAPFVEPQIKEVLEKVPTQKAKPNKKPTNKAKQKKNTSKK